MTAHVTTDDHPDGRWEIWRSRLLAMVLRPTARPLGWGIVVALGFLAVETLIVLYLTRVAPENAFGAIFLLGVPRESSRRPIRPGVASSAISTMVRNNASSPSVWGCARSRRRCHRRTRPFANSSTTSSTDWPTYTPTRRNCRGGFIRRSCPWAGSDPRFEPWRGDRWCRSASTSTWTGGSPSRSRSRRTTSSPRH